MFAQNYSKEQTTKSTHPSQLDPREAVENAVGQLSTILLSNIDLKNRFVLAVELVLFQPLLNTRHTL
ncbi:hypothetical protein PtA15_3A746 [Puccinia triticina]|uniref:Uncharacterized protein n=1 Tax=Puccinia triticina TaxID=208348 RepID=A0ABY7CDT1_9BASI|nr:uncharacterized protein PtA15_3A746 [Puccinia triticina]WAQ83376.1 hypothetical protein PtA15_3A746 [Puccinia triticina]